MSHGIIIRWQWAYSHLEAHLGEIHFSAHSYGSWQASGPHWLLARDISSSLHSISTGQLTIWQLASHRVNEQVIERGNPWWKPQCICNLILESHHFYHILLSRNKSSPHSRGGNYIRKWIAGGGIFGGLLRGCLPLWVIGYTLSALLGVGKVLPRLTILMYTFLNNKTNFTNV